MIGEKFNYLVQLQREDGNVIERMVTVGWSPAKVEDWFVANTGAAEASWETKVKHIGLTAVLQTEDSSSMETI